MARTPVTDCPAGPALDAAATKVLTGKDWEEGWIKGFLPLPYSTDIEMAWELESSLPASLRQRYIEMLITVHDLDVQLFDSALERGRPDVSIPGTLWILVHADELQRTRAFLLAYGVIEVEVADD